MNCFPHRDSAHGKISPRTIITASGIDHNKHCKLEFGSNVQVHEQHDNSLLPRTSGALTLCPTGNAQGSQYFLSLHSGRRVSCNNCTKLHMPSEVVLQVHHLSAACKNTKEAYLWIKPGNMIDYLNDNTNINSEITEVDTKTTTGVALTPRTTTQFVTAKDFRNTGSTSNRKHKRIALFPKSTLRQKSIT